MNLLDVVLVGLGVAAAVGGFRLGLLARASSWLGMALGLLLAARLLDPDLPGATPGSSTVSPEDTA